jgi:hypothetical protein
MRPKPLADLVHRGQHCFVCLNAFPYTSGHVMVMPYAHLDRLAALPAATAHELIDLAQRAEQVLEQLYHPQGYNFGLNLGQAAGAGVARPSAPARPASLGRRHQLHDHRSPRRASCPKTWKRPGSGCGRRSRN